MSPRIQALQTTSNTSSNPIIFNLSFVCPGFSCALLPQIPITTYHDQPDHHHDQHDHHHDQHHQRHDQHHHRLSLADQARPAVVVWKGRRSNKFQNFCLSKIHFFKYAWFATFCFKRHLYRGLRVVSAQRLFRSHPHRSCFLFILYLTIPSFPKLEMDFNHCIFIYCAIIVTETSSMYGLPLKWFQHWYTGMPCRNQNSLK